MENIKKEKDVAAFPPGNIVHIRVTKTAKPLCLGYCYPNKLSVERISSEDLCVLLMDRGMVDDHLPNSVLNALKRCKNQFLPNSPSELCESCVLNNYNIVLRRCLTWWLMFCPCCRH